MRRRQLAALADPALQDERFLFAQSSLTGSYGLRDGLRGTGRRVSKLFFQLLSSSPVGTA